MRGTISLLLLGGLLAGPFVRGAEEEPAPEHWSLRPRARPEVPRFSDPAKQKWVRNPVDAFVLEKLAKAGLTPAPDADPGTLVRRVTYDLTGLPPTPEEIADFVKDVNTGGLRAYEELVDRLLASPHYGERWGRHWLDVVRYAETEGFEYDRHRPGAWRYRDYVIQAFNDDKPFDRFVLEQLAGDEVDPADRELLTAAGFHRLGPIRRNAGNQNVAMSRNEVLTEMTDALGVAFLGLTMGCARCHDHKFDEISQKDYYRLQAFLAATHEHDHVLADPKTQADWTARTEKIKEEIKQFQALVDAKDAKDRPAAQEKIKELRRSLPAPLPAISTVRNLAGERTPIHVLKRGDEERKGPLVGPRALGALLPKEVAELPADVPKPRTALAKWLNEPDHPLTTRVLVNRVWQFHFGKGIVPTGNDFGVNGALPSHPELLDYLANEFIAGGRKIKPLHRLILLSSTYRQASSAERGMQNAELKKDPEIRLLSRFPRRRLAAEEVRDSLLAVAGKLNKKAGGPSVMVPVDRDLPDLLYDPTQWAVTKDEEEHNRRSVYLIVKRNLQLPFLQVFDQPDAQISCPRRESSTHALQALELLNGKLSNRLADAFAERLVRDCGADRVKQVERAFLLVAGRPPTPKEKEVALEFLRDQPLREFALALFNLNAFMYVN